MVRQNALGDVKPHRAPKFDNDRLARVTSTKRFEKYGMIEAVLLDYSQPFPVWVVGDVDRKPEDQDLIIVGYIDGRKDAPFLKGFLRGYNATDDYVKVEKETITLQLPEDKVSIKITKDGAVTINGVTSIQGDTSIDGKVDITGRVDISGDLYINGTRWNNHGY